MYGWAVANLTRATRYWVRRRRRRERHLRLTSLAVPFARPRHERQPHPLLQLLSLGLPGVALALLGLTRLPHRGLDPYLFAFLAFSLVFALRAYAARAPAAVRVLAVACSLAYPVLYGLAYAGVLA
ncbi:MAG: hypothetical protein ACYTEZ_01760 [Planctomycetota bacterium]|jgi:hypothetical protein